MLDKKDLQAIQQMINTAESNITRNTVVMMESKFTPRFDLLAERIQAIDEKIDTLAAKSKVEELEDEIKLLKIVIRQMNDEINALKAG